MVDRRRPFGAWGEARAALHLEAQGYRILDRNVRAGGVELDLVAARAGCIVFVEVKTRRSRRGGAPEEAVDHAKRRRLRRGAVAWLAERRPHCRTVRFDVITCECDGRGGVRLHHFEGAFDASD